VPEILEALTACAKLRLERASQVYNDNRGELHYPDLTLEVMQELVEGLLAVDRTYGQWLAPIESAPLLETLADFADMLQVDAPNAGGIRLYEAAMSDFPGNLMDRAAAKVARNHRFSRLPLAADFHKAIVPELEWIRAKRSWVSFLLSYFNRAIALKAAQERHNK